MDLTSACPAYRKPREYEYAVRAIKDWCLPSTGHDRPQCRLDVEVVKTCEKKLREELARRTATREEKYRRGPDLTQGVLADTENGSREAEGSAARGRHAEKERFGNDDTATNKDPGTKPTAVITQAKRDERERLPFEIESLWGSSPASILSSPD